MTEYEMYSSGMSIPEVSKVTGIPLSTLRFRFKNAGILRSRGDALRLASEQGRLGLGLKGKKRPPRSAEWCKKISQAKKGRGKGLSKKPSGYVEITMGDNKGRSQHVVVIEEYVGRRLFANECVHHINGIRDDNRLENLELMTRSEHASHHAKENNDKRNRDNRGRYQ